MRSYEEEMEALNTLVTRATRSGNAVLAPNQKEQLRENGVPDAMTEGFQQWNDKDPPTFAVSMLYRDRLYLPDNKTGQCIDCREAIQWTTILPEKMVHICAFCALRRERGDA